MSRENQHPAGWLFTVALPVVAGWTAIGLVLCLGVRLGYELFAKGVATTFGEDSWLYGLIIASIVAAWLTGVVFLIGQVAKSLFPSVKRLDRAIEEKPALTWAVVIGGVATVFGDVLAGIIDKDHELLKGFFKFGTGLVFAGAGYFFGKNSWVFKALGLCLWLGVPITLYAVAETTVRGTSDSPGQTSVLILFTGAWLAVAICVAVVTYLHRPRSAEPSKADEAGAAV